MANSHLDPESGMAATRSDGGLKKKVADTYLARYTNLRAYLDSGWRDFLIQKRPDSLENFPKGPAKFAFILQSDEALSIFRRFDWLSTYCLFHQQQALAQSEASLRDLCRERSEFGADHREADHLELISLISERFVDYADLAEAKYKLRQYDPPDGNAYNSLLNNVYRSPGEVEGIDYSWLFKEGDIMTLDSRPRLTHLAHFLDDVLTVLPGFVSQRLHMTTSLDRQKFRSKVTFISYDRLMSLTLVISTILALVFILVPVGLLFFFFEKWSKWQQFGTVVGWSVGFLLYLWLSTHASAYEALGAAASYCALLVVFLGLK